jgi:dynein heavy chain
MEDAARDLMYRMVVDYHQMIKSFCPSVVQVKSHDTVEIEGGKFPLFTIDLKFINANATTTAKFVYSTAPEAIFAAILLPFDQSFKALKNIIKVEKKVMKKLFWAYEPIVGVPHIEEPWAVQARQKLSECVQVALDPMHKYLETLSAFKELIEIDINEYALEAEKKFFPGETMNLPDLCALAKKHMQDSEAIFNYLPSSLNLGLVLIDCKGVKNMLSAKHKAIAARLFQLLQNKTRKFAEILIQEFRSMYEVVTKSPNTIEKLTEMREFISTLPLRIDHLSERISKNDLHFSLMEHAKWQISIEEMDVRWEVFMWPTKMSNEINKQEKNMRALEFQFKRSMEEEQVEFNQDLLNLQSDVSKLKDLTKLQEAAKNAETVRRLRTSLSQAEEKARVFNSREALFNATMTEYTELSEVTKIFEPFFDLWDCAEKWLSNKESWTDGPFLNLDPENVENSVNVLLKNLNKSTKAFERLNLPQCNVIAAQVRDEVDHFRPKVPLIIALRNPGMRDRHWLELSEKTGVTIPTNKDNLSLRKLVDLGLLKAMADVDKVAEKAAKEFGIETALDKMSKSWENVVLVVEAYRDTGTAILKGVDDYMSLLDEHITMTQVFFLSFFFCYSLIFITLYKYIYCYCSMS